MLNSQAYQELTRAEITVLNAFYLKRKMKKEKKSKKARIPANTYIIMNNGEIVFTYTEANGYGLNSSTFQRAIDKLLKVGFIEIAKYPSYHKEPTLFSISDNWKKYGKPGYNPGERKKREKGYGVGVKSRFSK